MSTGPDYSGVDMRGEVLLLSRSIVIAGNDTGAWGGQIVTSDFFDSDGVQRNGSTVMDYVEVYNCSQYDTMMGAMRFEQNGNAQSNITNSAIHHGLGVGVEITGARNTNFINTTVFSFKKFGINVEDSANLIFDRNVVVGINRRPQDIEDTHGAFLFCSKGSGCSNI